MIRQGECTVGCGACCKYISLQVPPEYGSNPDVRKWIELHGIRLTERDGGVFASLEMPCHALTEDGKCGVYGTDARPDMCEEWPARPEQIAEFEEVREVCTYSFIEPEALALDSA